ncbi:hypothetical protein KY358_04940 [Candidatus Woesearchaeota archaeon]|nr:hypothetical protein [Candidatus Woesearchaeota archaeon]
MKKEKFIRIKEFWKRQTLWKKVLIVYFIGLIIISISTIAYSYLISTRLQISNDIIFSEWLGPYIGNPRDVISNIFSERLEFSKGIIFPGLIIAFYYYSLPFILLIILLNFVIWTMKRKDENPNFSKYILIFFIIYYFYIISISIFNTGQCVFPYPHLYVDLIDEVSLYLYGYFTVGYWGVYALIASLISLYLIYKKKIPKMYMLYPTYFILSNTLYPVFTIIFSSIFFDVSYTIPFLSKLNKFCFISEFLSFIFCGFMLIYILNSRMKKIKPIIRIILSIIIILLFIIAVGYSIYHGFLPIDVVYLDI